MSAPPAPTPFTSPTRDDLLVRLRDWVAKGVSRAAEDHFSDVGSDDWDAARAMLEQLAALDGATLELPSAGTSSRAIDRNALEERAGEATTVADVETVLAGIENQGIGLRILVSAVPDSLVRDSMLRQLLVPGPVDWMCLTAVRLNQLDPDAKRTLITLLADALHDPTRIDVPAAITLAGHWFVADRMTEHDEPVSLLRAYAAGTVPAQVPTHQRLAAQSLSTQPAATPDILRTTCALAQRTEASVVKDAIKHPHATPEVWVAALNGPCASDIMTEFLSIPRALRVEAVWRAVLAWIDTADMGRRRNAKYLAQLLRSVDAEGTGPALERLIRADRTAAAAVLLKIGKRRIATINPAILAPLMSSSDSKVRLQMIQLMPIVGTAREGADEQGVIPPAPAPTRKR